MDRDVGISIEPRRCRSEGSRGGREPPCRGVSAPFISHVIGASASRLFIKSTCACATFAELVGTARALLIGERTALNFLQRLSGIATRTRQYVDAAAGRLIVLDTRKTTPTLRLLEKYAVRAGGGTNHRFGLYDAILIKDNHVRLAGGVKAAVARARDLPSGSADRS